MENYKELKDPGAGIVLRGMAMLALVLALVVGGYTLLLRKPEQKLPPPRLDPAALTAALAHPLASFPATLDWGGAQLLSSNLPSRPGWQIRYTAACNLARRGSERVPWATFIEIFDESQQLRNFQVRLKDGRLVSDETAARQIIVSGLRALSEWQQKQSKIVPSGDLAEVYRAVDELAQSPILELRTQAERTRAGMQALRS